MGLCSRAWFALMRRNLVYRKRHWIGSILELILPLLFVYILLAIKGAVENAGDLESEEIPASFPEYSLTPLSFQDYVTALRATRICVEEEGDGGFTISGILDHGDNWMVPFVKCDSQMCEVDGQDATPFCEWGIIAVSGTDDGGVQRAGEFQAWLEATYPAVLTDMPFDYALVQQFDSSSSMDDYVKSKDYGGPTKPKIKMGVVFEGNDSDLYSYQLRQNSTNYNAPEQQNRPASQTTPDTDKITEAFARDDNSVCVPIGGTPELGPFQFSCTGQYMYNGVITMQRVVGDFIINATGAASAGVFVGEAGVQFVPFPTRPYKEDGFFGNIEDLGGIIIVLGLLYPVASMISYIVKEKEFRQKELMKMLSVTESDIGWSWFVTFMLFHLITASGAAAISSLLYEKSDALILWIFWILTFMSMIVFCMAMAAITTKTTRAVLIGLLVFFAGVFLTLAVDYKDGNAGAVQLISLHPAAAFSYGLNQIGRLEENGIGLTVSNVSYSDNPSGYSFADTIIMMLVDCFLWGFVAWCLNRGLIIFSKSYWCSSRASTEVSTTAVADKASNSEIPYEPVAEALKRQADEGKSVEIHGLNKQFGDKAAVDGLTVSFYQGQISALLGHNGAGKTTTINMLTGVTAPSSGYATVAGRDIRTDLLAIRQDIGICPQHDCLFPDLTVREHLRFFCRLKGLYSKVSKDEAEQQIDQAIRDVALFEKRNTLSKSLSGGMKRKLSVAVAFCGGSEVVFLDEPTSGMDPFSRRFIWELIRRQRKNRCIILTTHFMDEADILGDRIAIMADGQLRCAGSSLFLKKTYGVGYQLTIEKNHGESLGLSSHGNDDENGDSMKEQNCEAENGDSMVEKENDVNGADIIPEDQGDVKDLVAAAVPEATLLSDVGTELKYQIPLGASPKFAAMFEGLDKETSKKTIVSYGVSMTTLDEVFLLVARGGVTEAEKSQRQLPSSRMIGNSATVSEDEERSARSRMNPETKRLLTRHVGALFRKRAFNFKRDKKAWVCTTVVPVLFVLVALLLFKFTSPDRNLDPVALDLSALNPDISGSTINPISVNNPGNPYRCQPGTCVYPNPFGTPTEITADEIYTFCGALADLDETGNECTINDSVDIASTLNGFEGAAAVGTDGVDDIRSSSGSLFDTSDVYASTQYGAIWFTHELDSTIASTGESFSDAIVAQCESAVASLSLNYSAVEDCEKHRGLGFVIQYNFTGLHTGPTYQALADQALVRYGTNNPDFVIKTTIAPLPITKVEGGFGQAEDVIFLWFLTVLAFPFIAGAFATFIVSERQSKAKHLQTVAGVEPAAYWISTFLWDIANYQIPLWSVIALLFAFQVEALTTSERDVFTGVLAIMFCFGPAAAGFTYCLSFAFNSPSMCNVFIIISGFLIGMGGPLTTSILELLALEDSSDPNTKLQNIATVLIWVLRFFPSFCFGKGLFYAINIETFAFVEGDLELTAWSEPVLLYEVYFLIGEAIVYTLLAILLDRWSTNPRVMSVWRQFTKVVCLKFLCGHSRGTDITTALPEDDDVIAEQDRVLAGDANDDTIVVSQMTKVYENNKIAVNNFSLGIHPGECFGLLGINGAGKTTMMGMLTAEFPPTTGDATLSGFSVTKEPQKIRRRIGYCPQFDAHFANMTGREHVELYASIKGIPKKFVREAAAKKLSEVGLSDYDSNRPCAKYSGGMKRRLSLACALIGQPQLVFLDECSTGVDPVARREIWELISAMVAGGKNIPDEERTSVILTTHSMEECEALCPRIAIMANGRMRCLGSAQHLKNKFGTGFQVELKVKIAETQDDDFAANAGILATSKTGDTDVEAGAPDTDLFFSLTDAQTALNTLTGDLYLSDLVVETNPVGYTIWKDAVSPTGVSLSELTTFATGELRMLKIAQFVETNFPNHQLRERQDTKSRYEVGGEGTRISSIFSCIEDNKEELRLADYGVSQTSLEQVFNTHAEEAEKLKQGRNDR